MRNLIPLRTFTTTNFLRASVLSPSHKANDIWQTRFQCQILNGIAPDKYFQLIINKISRNTRLHAVDLDVFSNVAQPSVHLEETVHLVSKFRQSIIAHTILPSTPHAVCRLFLDSNSQNALLAMLEERAGYGIFPDLYTLNLLIDTALSESRYDFACRLCALVMIQEDFGVNPLTDRLCLLALTKYISSKTDFSDWIKLNPKKDLDIILGGIAEKSQASDEADKDEGKEKNSEDEEEEEAEYVRIPFLRNEYFDDHFDLKSPREICGKSLTFLSKSFENDTRRQSVGLRAKLIGQILHGKWNHVSETLNTVQKNHLRLDKKTVEICKHYVANLHDTKPPSDEEGTFISVIDSICSEDATSFEEDVEVIIREGIDDLEKADVDWFKKSVDEWTEDRRAALEAQMNTIMRAKKIQEIKAKKEELRKTEEYLYFYDNLKKKKFTRIEYK